MNDEALKARQKATGYFTHADCQKCGAKFYVNTQYPQERCESIVEGRFCNGEIVSLTTGEAVSLSSTQHGCKKCGADMRPSKAIVCRATGISDFVGSKDVVTMSPDPRQSVQVNCLKCEKCGWSVSA